MSRATPSSAAPCHAAPLASWMTSARPGWFAPRSVGPFPAEASAMGNLKPLEEGSIKRARPSQYLFRAAACHLRAYAQRTTPEAVAKQSFNDPVTGIILKAATAPATTVGSGWADSLAALSIRDLVMEISSVSAAAALIQRGLQL